MILTILSIRRCSLKFEVQEKMEKNFIAVSSIKTNEVGGVTAVKEYKLPNGQLHRDGDLPAKIKYHQDGTKKSKGWWKNGEQHRDGDLPANIAYYKDGTKDGIKMVKRIETVIFQPQSSIT